MSTQVDNIKKNCMGTIDIHMKIKGMRKVQDFIVYPIKPGDKAIKIQTTFKILIAIGFVMLLSLSYHIGKSDGIIETLENHTCDNTLYE